MTQNSLTKIKSLWIARYGSEFDDKRINNFVLKSTELFKVNVKPKSVWFVQHVLSDNISSSDKRDDIEEGEILSADRRQYDKPAVSNYEETQENHEIHQVGRVGDKLDTVVKVSGNFGRTCDDHSTVKNSLNVSNDMVGDEISTLEMDNTHFINFWDDHFIETNFLNVRNDNQLAEVKGHGHFGNVGHFYDNRGRATSSFRFRYENSIHSNGSYYKHPSPGKGAHIRKDLHHLHDYGSNQRRSNGHGFRDVRHRHNSPKPYSSKYTRCADGFDKFYHRYNSTKSDNSKYNRSSESCNFSPKPDYSKYDQSLDHRKPLRESRWNSSDSPYKRHID